ncbi:MULTISPECIES: alpha/beta hydrolase [unclassified Sinorhizobium]|uniref:alpha/beta hydrolase n=1 Tax=unclassified Sinorhizobium TaxID=2613772 RepID=UPI003523FE50
MNMEPRRIADHTDRHAAIRSAAIPLTFAGTVGLFMPADAQTQASTTGVLIVGSWGFEEMCTRKFWRIIADDLALAGIASLRFDYPGTGDALDDMDFSGGLTLWQNRIVTAAERLRTLSGCTRLIVLAEGLGVPLGLEACKRLHDVAGLGLLAPVISGRAYLRELSIWSRMIDDNLGLREEQRDMTGISIAGLKMPEAVAAAVKKINIADYREAPPVKCLLLSSPARSGDSEFAAALESCGAHVERYPFDGFEQMISNVTYAKPPMDTIARIVDWVKANSGLPEKISAPAAIPSAEPLIGNGFRETPVRFGENDRLFGVLCEPLAQRKGATLVMMTTAYERHASWGRLMTHLARDMASSGIASLRFDNANVADSPPLPDAPEQVLYSEWQNLDVKDALDFLKRQGHEGMIAVGRCSGGFLAFRSAVLNKEFKAAVLVNPFAFYFDGRQSVESLLKFVPQSLVSYGPKAMRLETWRRIAKGDIKLKNAVINIGKALSKKAIAKVSPILKYFPFMPEEFREVQRSFAQLKARKVPLSLIYSESDVGLQHFSHHFGADGAGLKHYPNATLTMIADADHNLTPPEARQVFHEAVRTMALRFPPKA